MKIALIVLVGFAVGIVVGYGHYVGVFRDIPGFIGY